MTGFETAQTRANSLRIASIIARLQYLGAALALAFAATSAQALPPLTDFFASARNANTDARRAALTTVQRELVIALARRSLQTLSGLTPDDDIVVPVDALREEAPLAQWEGPTPSLPSVRARVQTTPAREQEASAARLALAPTLGMTASQNVSNTDGLIGHSSSVTGLVTLSWRFDVPTRARIKLQHAALAAARVEEEAAANRARDAIQEAWRSVSSGIATCRAARSQTEAAQLAETTARERYESGAGTQLERIQAQRDLSSAEATRIQADANLGLARTLLRLAVGEY